MYSVSEAYKTEMRQEVRNFSYIKIRFGVTDPDAQRYGYVDSTSDRLAYSSVPDIDEELSVFARYGTLEPGYWLLEGNMLTDPTNSEWQGFVGSGISDVAGVLSSPATVTIKFSQGDYYRFYGLTFRFDTKCREWPENVTVKSYLNDELVSTQTFDVTSFDFVVEHGVPEGDSTYLNKIVFEFSQMRLPNRRFRLEGLTLGVFKTITETRLIDASWQRTNDLMNSTAPVDSLSFSFYDEERFYNPENPEGIWSYLDAGQEITLQLGYELASGDIEWIPCGTHYTEGTPTVDDSGVLSKVSFSAVSRLQSLTDTYSAGTYSANGTTFYQLALNVLEFMDLEPKDYSLSETLKNYTTQAPLPVMAAKDLLQLIANAGMCLLYVDRDNNIIFTPRDDTTVQDFVFSNDCVYDAQPTLTKYPILKELTTTVHHLVLAEEVTELVKVEVTDADNDTYVVEYSMGTSIQISVDGTLVLNQTNMIGAYCSEVVVTGTGNIIVNGIAITDNTVNITKAFNVKGDSCAVDNQLVTSDSHCRALNSWLANVLSRRNQYKFSERGFPEVDLADNIMIDTYYVTEGQASIVANTISYSGALKADTEVLGV